MMGSGFSCIDVLGRATACLGIVLVLAATGHAGTVPGVDGGRNMPNQGIDHLVYACPDLASGIEAIERILGTRPVPGGRHPSYGTHNALLSLGPSTYLEVIARDPALPAPERGVLFEIPKGGECRLVTWVMRPADIDQAASNAQRHSIPLGQIHSGSREKPDGTVLSWKLTDPYALPFDGAVPFLIDWGSTPHPSGSVPRAGDLVELRILHPRAEDVRRALEILDAGVPVLDAEEAAIEAEIRTEKGTVLLR